MAADELHRAGIDDQVERLLSVEDAGVSEPAPGSYRYALDACGAAASETMLVAVHPVGDRRSQSRWPDRHVADSVQRAVPGYFRRPDPEVQTLSQFTRALT